MTLTFLLTFDLSKYSCRCSLAASTSKELAGLSREVREETSTSATVDVTELDVLYHDLPSYQTESVGDLATA